MSHKVTARVKWVVECPAIPPHELKPTFYPSMVGNISLISLTIRGGCALLVAIFCRSVEPVNSHRANISPA